MKKFLSLCLAVLMMIPIISGTIVFGANDLEIKLSSFDLTTELKQDSTSTLKVVISNPNDKGIHDVKVTLKGFSIDSIYVAGKSSSLEVTKTLAVIDPESDDYVSFVIKADPKAPVKSYSLAATIEYVYDTNVTCSFNETIQVSVTEKTNDPTDDLPDDDSPDPVDVTKPVLALSNFSSTPVTVTAGTNFTVKLDVTNNGSSAAKFISIMADNLDSEGFVSSTIDPVKYITTIYNPFKQSVTLDLKTSASMVTGVYPLNISCKYSDVNNAEYSTTSKIFISVVNNTKPAEDEKAKSASFIVKSASIPEKIGKPSLTTNLSVSLSNITGNKATDVRVKLSGFSDTGAILNSYTDTVVIGDVKANSAFNATFPIAISKNPTKSISLVATVTYKDSLGALQTSDFNVFIPSTQSALGDDSDTDIKSTPRVIMSNYSLDVDNVNAGGKFTFNFSLLNTSPKINVGNMKVSISSTDGIFSPVEGSSSFYTSTLNMGNSKDYSIMLSAKATAEAKSYPIIITVDYEDEKGNSYTVSESVNLFVSQPIRLEITDCFYSPESYGLYMPVMIQFNYFNKGKAALNNLTISAIGDFTLDVGQQYIGNFPASSYDTFIANLMPTAVGTQTGAILFSFEDAAGNPQTYEQPITVEVMEEQIISVDDGIIFDPDQEYDEFGNPIIKGESKEKDKLKGWQLALIIGGGVVVVGTITIIVVKVIKKKRANNDDDND